MGRKKKFQTWVYEWLFDFDLMAVASVWKSAIFELTCELDGCGSVIRLKYVLDEGMWIIFIENQIYEQEFGSVLEYVK